MPAPQANPSHLVNPAATLLADRIPNGARASRQVLEDTKSGESNLGPPLPWIGTDGISALSGRICLTRLDYGALRRDCTHHDNGPLLNVIQNSRCRCRWLDLPPGPASGASPSEVWDERVYVNAATPS